MRSLSRVKNALGIAGDLVGAATLAGYTAWRSHVSREQGVVRVSEDRTRSRGSRFAGIRAQFLIEGDPSRGLSPAARYRVCQYLPLLRDMGFDCTVRPSKPGKYFSAAARFQRAYARYPRTAILYAHSQHLRQILNRITDFSRSRRADVVLLQRDLLALSHSRLEDYLPLFNRHIVFDFDDAIFESPSWSDAPGQAEIDRQMRAKIARLCSFSSAVIAANPYLAEFASRYNDRVEVLPTSLCTKEFHPPDRPPCNPVPVIGWIGTSGNLYYLRRMEHAFQDLARRRDFVLRIVCNNVRASELPRLPQGHLEFVEWRAEGEIERIQELDVGIMPLQDDAWTRGKAGFKLIQYMACAVPIVYSPVGANPSVAGRSGDAGLAASTTRDWIQALERLIDEPELRLELGRMGRARAVNSFDLRLHAPKLARILAEVAGV